ncbi:MAG TPA: FHA domain-containing protein [Polyangiaceae bacterium]|nr:FHA domain-containing protein [Polyangiaceae bacterium]
MSTFLLKLADMRFPVRIGETLLGRSPYCTIVLDDPRVSRQHAAIRMTAEGLSIQDLGSRNGTLVNGQKLRGSLVLQAGDVVQLGAQEIEIELGADAATSSRRRLADTGDFTAAAASHFEGTGDAPDAHSETETPTEPGTPPNSLRAAHARKLSPPAGTSTGRGVVT